MSHGIENSKSAVANAKAWYESIAAMIAALEQGNGASAIQESILSVEVRSGWYLPGAKDADKAPAEYYLLLTTGGPALRLIGTLNEHGEPETARLEYQDWGTPWTLFNPGHVSATLFTPDMYDDYDSTLLAFASCFYFGE